MGRSLVRLAVLATLAVGCSLAYASSNGPPSSRTGAPSVGGVSAESNCTACHGSFALNTPGATLEILDVPEFYAPSAVYDLRVRLTSTFAPPRRWGFQITAVRDLNGQGAGTFDITGTTGIRIISGSGVYASRRYVEHLSAGTFPLDNGPIEWTFKWQAPSTDEGRIFFFCAGNAANNSGSTADDHIYTQRDTTNISPLLAVPAALSALDVLDAARPNPFVGSTAVSYALSRGGVVDLAVFDAAGRRVRELVRGERPAGRASISWDGRRDDGGSAEPGVYFVRLRAPGVAAGLTRRVTLMR